MPEPLQEPGSSIIPYQVPPRHSTRSLGLLGWIAGYKLVKAAIAIFGGIVVFRLGGKNLVTVGHRWLLHVGLDPEGKMGTSVLHRLSHFDARRLYWTMALFFAYALLYCIEAVGLVLEKRWAEWLTVFQTAILVPVEVYEMVRRPGPVKATALCLSLGVIFYLVWRIRDAAPQEAGNLPRA